MQSKLKSRLAILEKAMRKVASPAVPCESPALVLASRLAAMGIERGPNESLAETTARAMGISARELRAKLELLAGKAGAAGGQCVATDIRGYRCDQWSSELFIIVFCERRIAAKLRNGALQDGAARAIRLVLTESDAVPPRGSLLI